MFKLLASVLVASLCVTPILHAQQFYYPPQNAPAKVQIPPDQIQQMASCLVQIETTDATSVQDLSLLSVLDTTAFVSPIVQRTIDAPASAVGTDILVSAATAVNRFTRIDIVIRKGEKSYPEGSADKLMREMIAGIDNVIKQSRSATQQAHKEKLATAAGLMEAAKTRMDVIQTKLGPIREAMQSGESSFSEPSYLLQQLRQQRRSLEQQLNSSKSRLAQLNPDAESAQAWATAVKTLEEAVALAEAQQKAGRGEIAKVAELKASLADAKTQLARASTGGTRNQAAEVRSLENQIAESTSRLASISARLEKLETPEAAEVILNYRALSSEEDRLRNDVAQHQAVIALAEKAIKERDEVKLTVLDGAAQ